MKLKFVKKYKSIEEFNDVDKLPDFIVLTGVNGSGKTHLLEAIGESVDLEINNKINKNSVYFDYNDFIIKEIPLNNSQSYKTIRKVQNTNLISESISNLVDEINTKIKEFSHKYLSDENKFVDFLIKEMFYDRVNFTDIKPWEHIKGYDQIDSDKKKKIYDSFVSLIIDDISTLNGFIRYYRIAKQKNIHITQLTAEHFLYKENFLGELLENEFKGYREQQTLNDNNSEPSKRGEDVEYLKKKDFEDEHGEQPWIFFNEILKEYGCNDYLIDWESFPRPYYPQTPEQFVLKVSVKKENGESIPIGDLSSGEKTLMALAYQIYRNKKDGNLPEVLLLDEIDTCLHPSMTQQLLNVIDKVFISRYGMKVILVTHSPSTIALAPEEAVYVMHNDDHNIIQKNSREDALAILTEGFATLSESKILFENIISTQEDIIIFTEGETDINHILQAKKKLGISDLEFAIFTCTCATKLKSFLIGIPNGLFENKTIVGIFDYDKEGKDQIKKLSSNFNLNKKNLYISNSNTRVFAVSLPVPNVNFENYEYCPIEFLYPEKVLKENEMVKKRALSEINSVNYIREDDSKVMNKADLDSKDNLWFYKIDESKITKSDFSTIIEGLETDNFDNFKPLFDIIKEVKELSQ